MNKVLIAAGGTGGHVIPAQVVAEALLGHGIPCHFAAGGLSNNPYFDKKTWGYNDISASPLRLSPFGAAFFCGKTLYGVSQAYRLLKDVPLVVGFGSYHTVPLLLAALLRRIPFILYEANAVPGKVTRLFSSYALWTGCFFEEAVKSLPGPTVVVSHPLRKHLTVPLLQEEARAHYTLPSHRKLILVLGGSQGAECFSTLIPLMMKEMPRENRPSVLHLAGKSALLAEIRSRYEDVGVCAEVLPFEDQMQYAYSSADLVISRSGASAVAEIAAFRKAALFIPFPKAADDHQKKNAVSASKREGVLVIDEDKALPSVLAEASLQLLERSSIGEGFSSENTMVPLLIKTLQEMSS